MCPWMRHTKPVKEVTKYFLIGLRLTPQEGLDIWHHEPSQNYALEEIIRLSGKSPLLNGHEVFVKLLSTQLC